ncbi:hypothetical protein EPN29_13550 [bacterium]|nr:MAG: hypothetical protein EPN29_13550 [bacterium]
MPDANDVIAAGSQHRAWVLPCFMPVLVVGDQVGDDRDVVADALDSGALFRGYSAACGCGWRAAEVRRGDDRGEDEAWRDWLRHFVGALPTKPGSGNPALSRPRSRSTPARTRRGQLVAVE